MIRIELTGRDAAEFMRQYARGLTPGMVDSIAPDESAATLPDAEGEAIHDDLTPAAIKRLRAIFNAGAIGKENAMSIADMGLPKCYSRITKSLVDAELILSDSTATWVTDRGADFLEWMEQR